MWHNQWVGNLLYILILCSVNRALLGTEFRGNVLVLPSRSLVCFYRQMYKQTLLSNIPLGWQRTRGVLPYILGSATWSSLWWATGITHQFKVVRIACKHQDIFSDSGVWVLLIDSLLHRAHLPALGRKETSVHEGAENCQVLRHLPCCAHVFCIPPREVLDQACHRSQLQRLCVYMCVC